MMIKKIEECFVECRCQRYIYNDQKCECYYCTKFPIMSCDINPSVYNLMNDLKFTNARVEGLQSNIKLCNLDIDVDYIKYNLYINPDIYELCFTLDAAKKIRTSQINEIIEREEREKNIPAVLLRNEYFKWWNEILHVLKM
jgi:hypothetical protein